MTQAIENGKHVGILERIKGAIIATPSAEDQAFWDQVQRGESSLVHFQPGTDATCDFLGSSTMRIKRFNDQGIETNSYFITTSPTGEKEVIDESPFLRNRR